MFKRFKIGTGAVLGLAALALGGSAIAGASSSPTHARTVSLVSTAAEPKATGPDTDNIQSGDQTTPDKVKASESGTSGPDTDNIQSGDQTTPDKVKSSESGTSESSTPSDGPGGHADPAGNGQNQSGDQTTPDSVKAGTGRESSTESSASESGTSENSSPSDGPGGHADPASTVDNQQQGQN